MKPHEQRVISEKAELVEKLDRLTPFLQSLAFRDLRVEERHLLLRQEAIMRAYVKVLDDRIALFEGVA